MQIKRTCCLGVMTALALGATVPVARATTVSPMVIDLQTSGRNVVANISINNTGDKPLTMETVLEGLTPTDAGLVPIKGGTEDLLVTPPTALIPPGHTQSFRVQWIGDPVIAASRHYYVAINQLPVELPEGQSQVQIIYDFKVLVSVGPGSGKAALAIKSTQITHEGGKSKPLITVSNSGTTYGYLSQHKLRITENDAGGKVLFDRTISGNEFQQMLGYGIIATGQSRNIVFPLELPSSSGTVTATLLDERSK